MQKRIEKALALLGIKYTVKDDIITLTDLPYYIVISGCVVQILGENNILTGVFISDGSNDVSNLRKILYGNEIQSSQIIGLIHNNELVAYRFKTDLGVYDMRKEVAEKYNIKDIKVSKNIKVKLVNNFYVSAYEERTKNFIKDISESEKDCEILITKLKNI